MATQTAPVEIVSPPPPGIPEVMAAITTCQTALTGKLEAGQMDIGLIRQDLVKVRDLLGAAEQLVGRKEDVENILRRSKPCKQR